MAEPIDTHGFEVATRSFEYRSRVFDESSPREKLREVLSHSPYFLIAVAVNTTLVALATVWRLSEDRGAGREAAPILAAMGKAPEEEAKAPEPEKKGIFDLEDERVPTGEEPSAEPVPELDLPLDVPFSDHFETANDVDGDTARGTDLTGVVFHDTGLAKFDIVGIGSGSLRGGRRSYGDPLGGGRFDRQPRAGGPGRQSARTEAAVEAGLRWLARHQSPDGSWSPDGFTAQCQGGAVCAHSKDFGFHEYETGVTGLALLAYLGAGYDHRASRAFADPFTKKTIRLGDVVRRGLLWLKDQQSESGSFADTARHKWGYNHSIATLALCEAYGLSRAPQWKLPAQRGIDALIAGQNPAPGGTGLWGWRYAPQSGDNDMSVTGWCVMALKSADLAGLRIAHDSLHGALAYCEEVTDRTSGHAGYLSRADAGGHVKAPGRNEDFLNHPAMAAVGMCIRAFVKRDPNDPVLESSAKLLARDLPVFDRAKGATDYYYWYYGSLALNQYDGPDSPRPGKGAMWKEWESALQRALLDRQARDPKLCSDGSWDGDDRWGVDGGGRVYATAINTLTFEVYYRYGNAFGTSKK